MPGCLPSRTLDTYEFVPPSPESPYPQLPEAQGRQVFGLEGRVKAELATKRVASSENPPLGKTKARSSGGRGGTAPHLPRRHRIHKENVPVACQWRIKQICPHSFGSSLPLSIFPVQTTSEGISCEGCFFKAFMSLSPRRVTLSFRSASQGGSEVRPIQSTGP